MAISTEGRTAGPFDGNDVTVTFPFTFKIFADSGISVILLDANGDESVLTLDVDYTVSVNADQDDSPGGDCVLTTAPATGETLLIVGSTPQTQEAEILNLGGFYPRVINAALDKLTMAVQEMQAEIDRSIKVPVTSDDDPTVILSEIISALRIPVYVGSDFPAASGSSDAILFKFVGGELVDVIARET